MEAKKDQESQKSSLRGNTRNRRMMSNNTINSFMTSKRGGAEDEELLKEINDQLEDIGEVDLSDPSAAKKYHLRIRERVKLQSSSELSRVLVDGI